MSTYNKDLQKLLKQMRELRQRLARREQADNKRFRQANPDSTSAVKRDLATAREREKNENRNYQAQTGRRGRSASLPSNYKEQELKQADLVSAHRKRNDPNAKGDIGNQGSQSGRSDGIGQRSSGSHSSRSYTGGSSRSSSPSRPSSRPAPRPTRRSTMADDTPLRSDFSDIGGRLGAALGGAQDAILSERDIKKIEAGMNYGSVEAKPKSEQKRHSMDTSRPNRDSDIDFDYDGPDELQREKNRSKFQGKSSALAAKMQAAKRSAGKRKATSMSSETRKPKGQDIDWEEKKRRAERARDNY